jgi:hypothetical protein
MIVSKFMDGDIDGVLRRANATEFGLASGNWISKWNIAPTKTT